jgi:putative membrane protein
MNPYVKISIMNKAKNIGSKAVPEFLTRWLINSVGLYVSSRVVGGLEIENSLMVFLVGGIAMSVINSLIKPLVTILSFPFVIASFGIFMLVINGLMLLLLAVLVPGIKIEGGLITAILAGVMIGISNYFVSLVLGVRSK